MVWFEKAGKGELHDANQPLDPYFFGESGTVILPGQVFEQSLSERCDLVVVQVDEKSRTLRLDYARTFNPAQHYEKIPKIIFITYEIQPQKMSRLRAAPSDLASLHKEMEARGVNLFESLANKVSDWILEDDEWKQFRFNSHLGILLKMPVIHPVTGLTGAHSMVAFVTRCSLGDVGVSLGQLGKNNEVSCGLKYVLNINPDPVDLSKVSNIHLDPFNVTSSFEPYLAARMAGREKYDQRKVIMIGAGAVGSLVANSLLREGRFSWTIIDDDVLLPHNLSRHALGGNAIGFSKALCLKIHLQQTICGSKVESIVADAMSPADNAENVEKALQTADIILDASASVPVSRYLCDLSVEARRTSFFFNPAGTSAVLMVEDIKRTVNLRAIEAAFYSRILNDIGLADLLLVSPERLPYSGNCSALTTRMPSSRAQILSGLIAQELGIVLDKTHSLLKIWQLTDAGTVNVTSYQVESPTSYQLGEWKVRLLPQVVEQIQSRRQVKLPTETGGALLGVVDIPAKQIEVIAALPPPPDSEERIKEFVRGTDGLEMMVKDSMARTLDHIRYVGEWHSHPKGYSTRPSKIDLGQLAILAETLSSDDCLGIQIISGDNELNVILCNFKPPERINT
ncbi:ThiF family adenylyltransferase [uncultured Bilophila sp.]|uniref:ThiF family adenylyltransferase n=1 Tax=uncultured Bilophila sp. TaxID=529385 RepID=UPI0025DE09FD|nr:ThiF family adenylyltransferase [uncultured Bilophila sp.]